MTSIEEQYEFSAGAKKKVVMILATGLVLFLFGVFGLAQGWWDPANVGHGSHDEHATVTSTELHAGHTADHVEVEGEGHHAEAHEEHGHDEWSFWTRIKADFWHNNMYFIGIALTGVFFYAINYVAWAGWSAAISRVFLAMGWYLPVGAILIVITFAISNHSLFHWTHEGIMDPNSDHFDAIIKTKEWYLNMGFYISRMIVFLVVWIAFWFFLKREAGLEDLNGGTKHHNRLINISAGFIVFFGVSSSMSSWDWIMSIDTHWFSTMFGWYVFASWFVASLSVMTLIVIMLKDAGYLKIVNAEHLHDMGKFMFAFSIFWTYIWFSQFILYWYANIPEEGAWFWDRMFGNMGNYLPIFILNLIINFLFPFFFMMTRDAKRYGIMLKVAAVGIIIGHWFDFYLMIMPGVLKSHGGLNLGNIFAEFGIFLMYVAVFAGSVMFGLSKMALIPKNHPFIKESMNHHT